jgi:hypothetical protein
VVKAGYSALGVRIKVARKEKGYVFMHESGKERRTRSRDVPEIRASSASM